MGTSFFRSLVVMLHPMDSKTYNYEFITMNFYPIGLRSRNYDWETQNK